MPLVPFAAFLESAGLAFGLPARLLESIGTRTDEGEDCPVLLADPALERAGLLPAHLLRIRRARRRYRALQEHAAGAEGRFSDRLGPVAARWAARHTEDQDRRLLLEAAMSAVARATLERGRLRFHLTRPEDPRSAELSALAEHTEGCDRLPPHRWFAASRAVADGLLWIEVLVPDGEARRHLGVEAGEALVADLERAAAKPVLDALGARAERKAIATAADSLHALLARPAIKTATGGVYLDAKSLWVASAGEGTDDEAAALGATDLEGLAGWLTRRGIGHVGIAARGTESLSPVIEALSRAGLAVEPVRAAGLMKQARRAGMPLKRAAARQVALRLRDPLTGYADLEPDELGLGEYLDRVDPDRLHAALADARDVARWERARGKAAAPVARGMGTGQARAMVRGLDDLRAGMELGGVVVNLTHFGAFVELGIGTQGLVHLSELADRFVEHPSEVVQVGDRVRVRVLEIDAKRKRIALTMRTERDRRGPGKHGTAGRRGQAIKALDDLFKK